MSLEKQLENEISIIENDEFLTPQEKAKEIGKLEREARRIYREERESGCGGSQWQEERYEKEGW